jgi:hypothetical protein
LKDSERNLPKPTRLPPRFKSKLARNSIDKRIPFTKPSIKEEEKKIFKEISSSSNEIKQPVSIKKTRKPISKPTPAPQSYSPRVRPTRIELEEETVIVEQKRIKINKQKGNQLVTIFDEQELILKQFDVSGILNRPAKKSWPWVKSKTVKIPSELELYWRAEASLYSAIASLHFFTAANERGEIAPEVYSKQLRSHLMEAIQLRFKLEKDDRFNWDTFVQENQLEEFFPKGLEKLARVSGHSDIDESIAEETVKLDYQEMIKLPTKVADFVGNSIELMDIIRLQSIATVERLIPLLEDLRKILLSAKMFGEDYWIIKEVDVWIKRLYSKEPGTIPEDEELERLEMHVVRWLNDFRRELKNL